MFVTLKLKIQQGLVFESIQIEEIYEWVYDTIIQITNDSKISVRRSWFRKLRIQFAV